MSSVGDGVQLKIGIDEDTDKVIIEFDRELRWLGFTVIEAISFVETICEKLSIIKRRNEKGGQDKTADLGAKRDNALGTSPGE